MTFQREAGKSTPAQLMALLAFSNLCNCGPRIGPSANPGRHRHESGVGGSSQLGHVLGHEAPAAGSSFAPRPTRTTHSGDHRDDCARVNLAATFLKTFEFSGE